jgi:hypothetical protein
MGYGFASHIGLVRENSLGTLGGARLDFIKALSESVVLERERFEPINIHGVRSEPDDEVGLNKIAGDIEFAAHPVSIGFALAGVMGISSTAIVASGTLYQHTFTPRTADLETRRPGDTYSFEMGLDGVNSAFLFLGCYMSKLALSAQPNQDIRCTLSLVGITAAVGSKSTATYPGSPVGPFVFHASSISAAGAAITHVEQFGFEVDNQAEAVAVAKPSYDAHKIVLGGPTTFRVSGTSAFDDPTFYDYFTNQTEFVLDAVITRPNSFQLRVQCPRVVLTSAPISIGGRERITYSWEGMARYHTGSLTAMRIDLWNTRSGYALAQNGLSGT